MTVLPSGSRIVWQEGFLLIVIKCPEGQAGNSWLESKDLELVKLVEKKFSKSKYKVAKASVRHQIIANTTRCLVLF